MLRPVRLLAALALVAAAVAAPAHGSVAAAKCGAATARAAVTATHLRMRLLGDSAVPVDPKSVDGVICADLTRDGRQDVAVTIASGGTAGDIGVAVFRSTPSGWKVALAFDGYKLGLKRAGSDLVSTQPIYRKSDTNCCPTGGFDHTRYHWNGSRFVVVRSWHSKSLRP